jgi:hypothetical protein
MNAETIIEVVRSLVRPFVTVVATLGLVAVLLFLVIKFGSAEMAKDVLSAFLVLVASITSFWFATRKAGQG